MTREILEYRTPDGHRPFSHWLFDIKDKRITSRIQSRLDRLLSGNFGDTKLVGIGVWELRFHFGAGYRIYFGLDGLTLVILLYGGNKSSQDADIRRARDYWKDYLDRRGHEASS